VNLILRAPGPLHSFHSTRPPHVAMHRTRTPRTATHRARTLPPMLTEEDRSPVVRVGRHPRSEERTPIAAVGLPVLGGGLPVLREDTGRRCRFTRAQRTARPWLPPARPRGRCRSSLVTTTPARRHLSRSLGYLHRSAGILLLSDRSPLPLRPLWKLEICCLVCAQILS
jgi:hypothetical protein